MMLGVVDADTNSKVYVLAFLLKREDRIGRWSVG